MKKIALLLCLVGSTSFGQVSSVTINANGTVINENADHTPKSIKFATGQLLVNGVAVIGGPTGVTSVSGTAPIVSSGGGTPAISITAATTVAPGSMSAADKTKLDAITGTNTGDQTITLTGNVTGSGTGSFATTIANDAVTYAKMQNVSAGDTILGRVSVGAGNPEELTIDQVLGFVGGPTHGDIMYHDGTRWSLKNAGTNGQVFTTHGNTQDPTWETPSAPSTGFISDLAYGSSWNEVTTIANTKNSIYDWGHLFDTDDDGKVNVLDLAAGIVKTDASGVVSVATSGTDYGPPPSDTAYNAGTWDAVTTIAPSQNAVRDKISAIETDIVLRQTQSQVEALIDGRISDNAYDATDWNDNPDAPSKNAVRDKIEAVVASIPTGGVIGTAVITITSDTATVVSAYGVLAEADGTTYTWADSTGRLAVTFGSVAPADADYNWAVSSDQTNFLPTRKVLANAGALRLDFKTSDAAPFAFPFEIRLSVLR